MIPDSFHSVVCAAWGLIGRGRARRSEATEAAVRADETYVAAAEAHDVVTVFEFAQSDEFACKGFADEESTSL
ncbi:hypothetical protein Rleg9DRAFT_2423, partial [Rhizobium leguminosarum bv. trifolii WSM597]